MIVCSTACCRLRRSRTTWTRSSATRFTTSTRPTTGFARSPNFVSRIPGPDDSMYHQEHVDVHNSAAPVDSDPHLTNAHNRILASSSFYEGPQPCTSGRKYRGVISSPALLVCHAELCYAMLRYAMLCSAMLCHVMW